VSHAQGQAQYQDNHAAKHGALSNPNGEVRVSWRLTNDRDASLLNFEWQETSGPPIVAEPTRQGFGTALIKAVFENALFEYPRSGFHCRIEAKIGGRMDDSTDRTSDDKRVLSTSRGDVS